MNRYVRYSLTAVSIILAFLLGRCSKKPSVIEKEVVVVDTLTITKTLTVVDTVKTKCKCRGKIRLVKCDTAYIEYESGFSDIKKIYIHDTVRIRDVKSVYVGVERKSIALGGMVYYNGGFEYHIYGRYRNFGITVKPYKPYSFSVFVEILRW